MRERLPFLFIQCRPDGDIARDEKETIAQVTGLTVGDSLRTHLLLAEPNLDPVHDLDIKNNYAGLIISGSPFGAEIQRDLAEPEHLHLHARLSALVRYLLDNDFPTLGLCYGLQMLALASGTALTGLTAEDLQAVEVTLTEEGKRDSVTGKLPPVIRAYTGHADSLAAVPSGATLLASGEHCKCQIVRFGKNIYGTQFHPEITTAGMQIRIDQYGDAYYAAAEREAVIARCMSQDVTSSHRLLSAFTEHYRR